MSLNIGDLYGQIFLEDKLSGGLDAAGKKMQGFGRSMLPLSAAIGGLGIASMKFATDLNASMANVATLIPGNTERVLELKESVQDLAVATGKSSGDIAGGLYQVISAFGDTADTVQILDINARAATAGLATTEQAIALTSAVTKGYGDTTAEAVEKAADLAFVTVKLGQTTFPELAASIGQVVPFAEALGVAQEELFAGFATLTGVTGNAAEVSTQFKAVMAAMLTPTKEMEAAIADLGYGTADATIKELGLVGAMRGLIDSTDGSKAAIAKLFPSVRALPAVFALTGGQAEIFDEKLGKMVDTAGAGKEAFNEITTGVNAAGFAFKQMKEQLRGAAEDFGDKLLPIVTKFALNVVPPLLSGLEKLVVAFGEMPPWLQTATVGFFGLVAAAGPVIYVLGTMTTAVGALAGALSVGLMVALGKVAAVLVVGWATYAFTTWLIDVIVPTEEWKNALYDVFLELTRIGPLLRAYNAEVSKSRSGIENMTKAERALHEEWVKGTAARTAVGEAQAKIVEGNKLEQAGAVALLAKMNDLAKGSIKLALTKDVLAEAQKDAFARTNEGVIATVRAAEADKVLQAASDLLGQQITDLGEAQRILQVAAENSTEALQQQKKEAEDLAKALRDELAAVLQNEVATSYNLAAEEMKKFNDEQKRAVEAARAADQAQLAAEAALSYNLMADELDDLAEELDDAAKSSFDWSQALRGATLIVGMFSDDLAGMVGILGNVREAFKDAETGVEKFGAVMEGVGQIGALAGGQLGKSLQGIAGGAMAGMQVAGPWGAAVGGAIGLVTSFIGSAEEKVNDLRDEFFETQGGFEEFSRMMAAASDEDWAKKIFDATTVQEFNDLVREAKDLLDTQGAAQEALNEAVERYGFTIEELGPAMQRQELDKMAGQLLTDWSLLIASGIDINTVIERMGPNIVDFVEKSISAGQAIPLAMKPMVDQLIESGQLLDENGEAFGSAEEAGITFAQSMSEQFQMLIEKIGQFVDAIMGIDPAPITVPVNVDAPGAVHVKVKLDWPHIPSSVGVPAIPTMQHGGIVTRPTLAVVGDQGPEAIIPLGPGGAVASFSDLALLEELRGLRDDMARWPEVSQRAARDGVLLAE